MSENKKKQHYVPQFYLKSYSGKDRINAFDKNLKINQPNTLVRNLGHENYYYNLPQKVIDEMKNETSPLADLIKKNIDPNLDIENFNKQFLEDYFEKLESSMALRISSFFSKLDTHQNLLHSTLESILSHDEKEQIANFLAVQAIRTPSFRQLGEKVRPLLTQSLPPFLASHIEAGEDLDDNERLLYHLASGILSRLPSHFIDNFQWQLAVIVHPKPSPIPHVAKSHVTEEFLLSDNPVANIKNIPNNEITKLSLEFSLPLTSRYMLLLREPNYPFGMSKNSIFGFTPNDVRIYNDYQLRFSSRKIFYNNPESRKKIEKYFKYFKENDADKFAVITG